MHCVDIMGKIVSLLYFAVYDRLLVGTESKANGRREVLAQLVADLKNSFPKNVVDALILYELKRITWRKYLFRFFKWKNHARPRLC